MSLLDTILLLIETNKKCIKDPENKNLKDKNRKLRYYFFINLKDYPERAKVVKRYLETILKNMEKRNINNEEYDYIKSLYKRVEIEYLIGLKGLTLNQKRNLFSRNFNNLLYKKDAEFKKILSI